MGTAPIQARRAISTANLPHPCAAVFAVIADPHTYPDWLVGAKRILSVDPEWPKPGSTFRHVVGIGPIMTSDTTSSLAVHPPTSLELAVRARPFLARATVRFELRSNGDTTVIEITETPRGRMQLIAPFLLPILRARNDRSLRQLRAALAAAGSPAAPPFAD